MALEQCKVLQMYAHFCKDRLDDNGLQLISHWKLVTKIHVLKDLSQCGQIV